MHAVSVRESADKEREIERETERKQRQLKRDALHPDAHAEGPEADHREEAVPEDRGRPVGVDPSLGHHVEERVDGQRAEEGDGVDVRELRLAGL